MDASDLHKDYIGSTGLVNTLLIQDILGLQMKSDKIILQPRLPEEWKNQKITYHFPIKKLMVEFNLKDQGVIDVILNVNSTHKEISIKNYEENEISF